MDPGQPQRTFLVRALVFTFLAHGAAMLLMLAFLLPLVPGGTGTGGELARVMRIAASPTAYWLGWLGWQVTAASDIVFAIAIWRALGSGPARRAAIAQLVLVVLAVIPDQTAQFLLVTRGIALAREAATSGDASAYLAYEAAVFPLTTAWAALLYTLSAVGWVLAFRNAGIWSRALAWMSAPLLVLFFVVSLAPIMPVAIRPSGEAIGAGNAIAFTLLEGWFVAVWLAISRTSPGADRGPRSSASR